MFHKNNTKYGNFSLEKVDMVTNFRLVPKYARDYVDVEVMFSTSNTWMNNDIKGQIIDCKFGLSLTLHQKLTQGVKIAQAL